MSKRDFYLLIFSAWVVLIVGAVLTVLLLKVPLGDMKGAAPYLAPILAFLGSLVTLGGVAVGRLGAPTPPDPEVPPQPNPPVGRAVIDVVPQVPLIPAPDTSGDTPA